jgi:hypothetical protein
MGPLALEMIKIGIGQYLYFGPKNDDYRLIFISAYDTVQAIVP